MQVSRSVLGVIDSLFFVYDPKEMISCLDVVVDFHVL